MEEALKDYLRAHKKEFRALRDAVRKYDRICIFRHIKPDFDALGCQFGLYHFLRENFPGKEVHQVGDTHPTFVPRLFPAPEKIPNSWFDSPFLAIVLDVGDKERIADPRFEKAEMVIKIDHHPFRKPDVSQRSLLDEKSASCGELVTAFLASFGRRRKVSEEAARALYIAIVGDSGRFLYGATSPLTFAAASWLIKKGIDIRPIYLSMYEKKIGDQGRGLLPPPRGGAQGPRPSLRTGQGAREHVQQHRGHQRLVLHHRGQRPEGALLADLDKEQGEGHLRRRPEVGRGRPPPGLRGEVQGSLGARDLPQRPGRVVLGRISTERTAICRLFRI